MRGIKPSTSVNGREAREKKNVPFFQMKEVYFVNTTFRDCHMSLWSERMTTGMILPVAALADRAGFVGMEIISTSISTLGVRELLCHLLLLLYAESLISISAPRARATFLSVGKDTRS